MDKIIVINGKGGIGKDTLIEALADAAPHYIHVSNISSITPIVNLVKKTEVLTDAEKDLPYRKLLSDMKQAVDSYYCEKKGISYTQKYLSDMVMQWEHLCEFGKASHHVIFVHIREPEAIFDFLSHFPTATTLVVDSEREKDSYGNDSDDHVYDFSYDYIFEANGTKEEEAADFCSLIEKILIGG